VVISDQSGACAIFSEDGICPPSSGQCRKRIQQNDPDPNIRLLMRTSGTSGKPRIAAISDQNLLAVLDSHLPRLGVDQNSIVASVLPWHHSFGLVLDLLVSLLSGAIVVRDPHSGRDSASLAKILQDRHVTHLSAVPLTIQRLFAITGAVNLVQQLRGGLLGGAPVCRSLATQLNQTRLRAGYGQTEASPGITLGEPGQWSCGWIGHPVGCEAQVTDRGTLAFKGQNSCLGYFHPKSGGLEAIDGTGGWSDTGDLVEGSVATGFTFLGRIDDCFKLGNGRWVEAGLIESKICRSIPDVDEAIVFTHDFERLFVALSTRDSMPMPARSLVLSVIGPLAGHVAGVIPIAKQGLLRTGKGTIDRLQLSQSVKHAA
jgi:long-subunit acyl-CoA synthetase (AMP-forming)